MKRICLAFAFACTPVLADEMAVLQNGFTIAVLRHETLDGRTRLFTSTGTLEFADTDIVAFEPDDRPRAAAGIADPPAAETKPLSPQELVVSAALKHGLLPEFVRSVAAIESAWRPAAISPRGARGLMQLMPGTAAALGVDPNDPAQNAEAGARYLRQLLNRYKDARDPVRLALAAYNAGPGAVDRYKSIPPYRETKSYIDKVLKLYMAELHLRSRAGT